MKLNNGFKLLIMFLIYHCDVLSEAHRQSEFYENFIVYSDCIGSKVYHLKNKCLILVHYICCIYQLAVSKP